MIHHRTERDLVVAYKFPENIGRPKGGVMWRIPRRIRTIPTRGCCRPASRPFTTTAIIDARFGVVFNDERALAHNCIAARPDEDDRRLSSRNSAVDGPLLQTSSVNKSLVFSSYLTNDKSTRFISAHTPVLREPPKATLKSMKM